MTSAGVRTIDGRTVPAVGTWAFEAGNSEIGFSVKHLVISRVRGAFREFEGEIRIAEDFAASVATARIAAASIDTGMAPRDNDLRGADFLDAQQHPYLEFRSTGVTVTDRQWQVTGDLTIAGAYPAGRAAGRVRRRGGRPVGQCQGRVLGPHPVRP